MLFTKKNEKIITAFFVVFLIAGATAINRIYLTVGETRLNFPLLGVFSGLVVASSWLWRYKAERKFPEEWKGSKYPYSWLFSLVFRRK